MPDLGDFADVEIIEVLVKPGDEVTKEQALLTLETEKASMDVPAPLAGKVLELKVKVADCTTGQCGCWVWCTNGQKKKVAAEGSSAHCKEVGKSMCEPAGYLAHQYTPCNTGRGYKLGYTLGVNACGAAFFGLLYRRRVRRRGPNTD